MPLILTYQDCRTWLDPNTSSGQIQQLIKPFDENQMKAHTISKLASNTYADRNVKEILDRVDYPELNQQSLF